VETFLFIGDGVELLLFNAAELVFSIIPEEALEDSFVFIDSALLDFLVSCMARNLSSATGLPSCFVLAETPFVLLLSLEMNGFDVTFEIGEGVTDALDESVVSVGQGTSLYELLCE
jgi:hypothetical protein